MLVKMVGTWQGTGPYGLWQRSDGVLPGSRVYAIDLLWDDAEELLASASDLCDRQWELQEQAGAQALELEEAERLAALEAEKKKQERQEKLALAAIAVLGLFAVTR